MPPDPPPSGVDVGVEAVAVASTLVRVAAGVGVAVAGADGVAVAGTLAGVGDGEAVGGAVLVHAEISSTARNITRMSPSPLSLAPHRVLLAADAPRTLPAICRAFARKASRSCGLSVPAACRSSTVSVSVGITLDTYSHVLPGLQAAAAAELDAMLDKPKAEAV
jgi:hypothetical protein